MMLQKLTSVNMVDEEGNPAGGYCLAVGVDIQWQKGPLGRDKDREEPNGAFVETGIAAMIQRIEWYQTVSAGKFACRENALAITKLEEALHWLNSRTQKREDREVEGTHEA